VHGSYSGWCHDLELAGVCQQISQSVMGCNIDTQKGDLPAQWLSSEIKLSSIHCAWYGQRTPSGALN